MSGNTTLPASQDEKLGVEVLSVTLPETRIETQSCASCAPVYAFYSLDKARKGDHLEIVRVDDEHARVQCLRFGMAEGACVTCVTRIPAGPLVLKSGRQEIAVGRKLAKRIHVRSVGEAHA